MALTKEGGPMTEADWLVCEDPGSQLSFLREKAGNRKFWLFVAAGAGIASHVLPEQIRQEIVQVGIGFADGTVTQEERLRVHDSAQGWKERCVEEQDFFRAAYLRDWQDVLAGPGASPRGYPSDEGARRLREGLATAQERGFRVARWIAEVKCYPQTPLDASYRTTLCGMLRDLFGNPFRPVSCHSDWLRWNGDFIAALAAGMYLDNTFDRLPILADALEDAGCTDRAILDHCRSPGSHVRGCWVVDLLLGKS
jgi:hypothetical protein